MIHPSLEFLAQLDPSPTATFNIECFTDSPKGTDKPKPDPLVRRYPNKHIADVEALIPELEALNDMGAAIHVARNQCTGQRRTANITRVRGVHADMDGVTKDQLHALVLVLQPSIVVQSSGPQNVHFYWQLSDGETTDNAEAKAINQTLVTYGADPAAVDPTRLLRLPGFKHMKYRAEGKTPTVSAEYSGLTYSADQIRTAFPPKLATQRAMMHNTSPNEGDAHRVPNLNSSTDILPEQLISIGKLVEAQERQLWSGNWQAVGQFGQQTYPSQSEADLALASSITKICVQQGIPTDVLPNAVETIFSASGLGTRDKWTTRPEYRSGTIMKVIKGLDPIIFVSASGGLLLDSHGDIRNAKAFAQAARNEFLYVKTSNRWLQWQDLRWRFCEKEEHFAMAKKVCTQMLAAANAVFGQDPERGKRLIQDAIQAHNLPRVTAMLKLSVSERDMVTTDRELDSDPYLIGIENGVVDLRSGKHLSNNPDFRITRYCNASFEANTKCDLWLKFLGEIFDSDTQTIDCVQRLLGLTLLGISSEEILIICYGHGANGKSVFSNVLHRIMGGYSVTAPSTLLTARRQDDTGPRNDLAALAGARSVSINELQAGDRLDEQVVKSLAGREPIAARFLHKEFFEFLPSFTPWLRTNHKPIITGEDDGIWRRLALLRFGRKFSENEQDPQLEKKLLDERNGILIWIMQGAQSYLCEGIKQSPKMIAELATYRNDSDLLGEFLGEKTSSDTAGKVLQQRLFNTYVSWCRDTSVRPMSKKQFTQRLAERGLRERKSGSERFYVGLSMKVGSLLINTGGGGGDLDSMDRMFTDSDKSPYENSILEKPQNSSTSCPTCPTSPQCEEKEI